MSMAQQLILRGLVASFWNTPYTERPARWGTALQDRFALPHFVWQDMGDVVGDLKRAGYPFDTSWFIPHYEFRFPISGEAASAGIDLQLRQAIEPWHVLGEESTAGGQARYVDSSLERLQVKVTGYADDRYAVACNGHRVPLQPTGVSGEYVAGVRFRAWQPPSALHPRIRRARAARLRRRRSVEPPLRGRLHVPRRAPGRPVARAPPRERPRGRGPPPRALFCVRPHPRRAARGLPRRGGHGARISADARFAPRIEQPGTRYAPWAVLEKVMV